MPMAGRGLLGAAPRRALSERGKGMCKSTGGRMDGARSIDEDSEVMTVVPGAGERGAGRSSVRGEPELEVAGEDGAYCRGSEPSAEEGREAVSGEDGGERVSVKSEASRVGCGVNIVQEKKGVEMKKRRNIIRRYGEA